VKVELTLCVGKNRIFVENTKVDGVVAVDRLVTDTLKANAIANAIAIANSNAIANANANAIAKANIH
jgi:hypothetical protein